MSKTKNKENAELLVEKAKEIVRDEHPRKMDRIMLQVSITKFPDFNPQEFVRFAASAMSHKPKEERDVVADQVCFLLDEIWGTAANADAEERREWVRGVFQKSAELWEESGAMESLNEIFEKNNYYEPDEFPEIIGD